MTTARETMLLTLDALAGDALKAANPALVYLPRNAGVEHKLEGAEEVTVSGPAVVFASLKDGDPQDAVPLLGSDLWDHAQGAVLEFLVLHPDSDKRDAALDLAMAVLADALKANPTLGGCCDYAQVQAPSTSVIGDPDAPMGKSAEIGIEVLFHSLSPIG